MPAIDPFVADIWIRSRLLESSALMAMVSNRIHPMRQDFTPISWPFVLYTAPSQQFDTWADQITIGKDEYRVYALMREDKLTAGVDIEGYLQPAYTAILKALDGVSNPVSTNGLVHSCQIVRPIRRIYGETTKQICEMGVVVRLITT